VSAEVLSYNDVLSLSFSLLGYTRWHEIFVYRSRRVRSPSSFSGSGTMLTPRRFLPLQAEPTWSRPCLDKGCEVGHCAGDLEPWDRGLPSFCRVTEMSSLGPTSPLRDIENCGSLRSGEEAQRASEDQRH